MESMQSEQRKNKTKTNTQSLREMRAIVMWASRHKMRVSEAEDRQKWSRKISKRNGWIKTLIYTSDELNALQTEQMQNESHSDVW